MTTLKFVKLSIFFILTNRGSSNVDSQGIRRACLGDELMLTCETYGTALTWTVTPNRNTNRSRSTTTISVLASNTVSRSVMILNNEFKFTSTIQESQLLVSLLQIDNVSANISGALIQCATSEEQVHSTIIYIVGNDHHLSTNVTTVTESGAENVTVMFEWVTVDEDPLIRNEGPTYEYAMEVSPQALTRSISNNSACLVLQYNVLYTVKIVVCLCGQSNVVINSTVYYPVIKCGYPLNQMSSSDSSLTMITGYNDPALVGTNIIISCLVNDGDTENKTMVLTCMDDGQWDPDPQLIGCRKSTFPTTPAEYTRECDCDATSTVSTRISISHGTLAAVIISVILFGCLLFIAGSVSGCLCHKYKHLLMKMDKHRVPEISGSTRDQSELEMTENVAYGPVKHGSAQ